MAELLDSAKSSYRIEEIIKNSEEKLALLTPVFRLSEKLFGLLKEASERGVRITVIFCTDELEPVEKILISELSHIEICHSPELNARCYFNEREMIITSMSLHDIQERKNGDISMLISRSSDSSLYDNAAEFFESIHNSSVKLVTDTAETDKKPSQTAAAYHGFCIRCAMPISFNIKKPYCRQCMNDRNSETDVAAEEKYCHSCARKTSVRIEFPLCKECTSG